MRQGGRVFGATRLRFGDDCEEKRKRVTKQGSHLEVSVDFLGYNMSRATFRHREQMRASDDALIRTIRLRRKANDDRLSGRPQNEQIAGHASSRNRFSARLT